MRPDRPLDCAGKSIGICSGPEQQFSGDASRDKRQPFPAAADIEHLIRQEGQRPQDDGLRQEVPNKGGVHPDKREVVSLLYLP